MSDKVKDTIASYDTLLPTVSASLKTQVQAWADANGAQAKSSIELGGKLHSDAEKNRRRAVRAHLLATQALGLSLPAKPMPALREELIKLSYDSLKNRLQTDIQPYVMDQRADRLVFGWSFRAPGTGPLRDKCRSARSQVGEVLKAASKDLAAVCTSKKASRQYSTYFGAANWAQTAQQNIGKMLVEVQSKDVWFYYRGQSVTPNATHSDWPYVAGELGGLGALDCIGATINPSQRQAQGKRQFINALQKNDDGVHIMLGRGSDGHGDSEVLHTLIHELSHFAAGTRDVKAPGIVMAAMTGVPLTIPQQITAMGSYVQKTGPGGFTLIDQQDFKNRRAAGTIGRRAVADAYGDEVCQTLAQNYPDKAVWNADSVAYYCMQFAT